MFKLRLISFPIKRTRSGIGTILDSDCLQFMADSYFLISYEKWLFSGVLFKLL